MAVRDLYFSCTGISGIREVTVDESMAQAAVTASIVCTSHTLSIGDTVTLDLGYVDDHSVYLTDAIVKEIVWRRPENNYLITIADKLSQAVDYFIASDDPDNPLTVENIEAKSLVTVLLLQAGLSPVNGSSTIFTYATTEPYKINLVTVWQLVETIGRVCGCITYCETDGSLFFDTRKPYIEPGDTTEHTFTVGDGGDIEAISYLRSDEWLRNRIVVYGLVTAGVFAEASDASPYLPGGINKSMVIAHELIDTVEEAQRTADVNLEIFNRLTETVSLSAIGNPSLHVRDVVAVTEPFTGLEDEQFIVFAVQHSLGPEGFRQEFTLTK